jgi:hypothetical protein
VIPRKYRDLPRGQPRGPVVTADRKFDKESTGGLFVYLFTVHAVIFNSND